jgi:1,4-dihydroxy-2-naphthoyl-CoA hydrolase
MDKATKLELLNAMCENTLMEHLGMVYTDSGDDFLCAKMPVDYRTHQPYGLLHGGASVALAESVGSAASHMMIDPKRYAALAQEINANHVKSAKDGFVHAKATLVHQGRTTHIWDIQVTNDDDELVCICRLTMSIIEKKS